MPRLGRKALVRLYHGPFLTSPPGIGWMRKERDRYHRSAAGAHHAYLSWSEKLAEKNIGESVKNHFTGAGKPSAQGGGPTADTNLSRFGNLESQRLRLTSYARCVVLKLYCRRSLKLVRRSCLKTRRGT